MAFKIAKSTKGQVKLKDLVPLQLLEDTKTKIE
jgi:hypothetical protein